MDTVASRRVDEVGARSLDAVACRSVGEVGAGGVDHVSGGGVDHVGTRSADDSVGSGGRAVGTGSVSHVGRRSVGHVSSRRSVDHVSSRRSIDHVSSRRVSHVSGGSVCHIGSRGIDHASGGCVNHVGGWSVDYTVIVSTAHVFGDSVSDVRDRARRSGKRKKRRRGTRLGRGEQATDYRKTLESVDDVVDVAFRDASIEDGFVGVASNDTVTESNTGDDGLDISLLQKSALDASQSAVDHVDIGGNELLFVAVSQQDTGEGISCILTLALLTAFSVLIP